MNFGDLEGKGSVYSIEGEPKLIKGEEIVTTLVADCGRGWRRYKLGWRPIFYEGEGTYYLTNERLIYLRRPRPHPRIHTINIQHEIGDFGGWAYHAHRSNRAFEFGGLEFFEFPYEQIEKVELEAKNNRAMIFINDTKNKYKLYVDMEVGEALNKHKALKL